MFFNASPLKGLLKLLELMKTLLVPVFLHVPPIEKWLLVFLYYIWNLTSFTFPSSIIDVISKINVPRVKIDQI